MSVGCELDVVGVSRCELGVVGVSRCQLAVVDGCQWGVN